MRDVGVPFWNRLSKPGNYKWKLLWKIWKVWKCVRSLSVGKTMFPMALQTQPSPLAVSSNSQTMFSWSISTRRIIQKCFYFCWYLLRYLLTSNRISYGSGLFILLSLLLHWILEPALQSRRGWILTLAPAKGRGTPGARCHGIFARIPKSGLHSFRHNLKTECGACDSLHTVVWI